MTSKEREIEVNKIIDQINKVVELRSRRAIKAATSVANESKNKLRDAINEFLSEEEEKENKHQSAVMSMGKAPNMNCRVYEDYIKQVINDSKPTSYYLNTGFIDPMSDHEDKEKVVLSDIDKKAIKNHLQRIANFHKALSNEYTELSKYLN